VGATWETSLVATWEQHGRIWFSGVGVAGNGAVLWRGLGAAVMAERVVFNWLSERVVRYDCLSAYRPYSLPFNIVSQRGLSASGRQHHGLFHPPPPPSPASTTAGVWR
jgi:hypothetical protein